jgi:thymidylate kinase
MSENLIALAWAKKSMTKSEEERANSSSWIIRSGATMFATLIDLLVFVDTPLDVAMARRIIRDHSVVAQETAAAVLDRLRAELAHYLEKARYPYLNTDRHKSGSDLVLDGCRSLQELRNNILERIRAERNISYSSVHE